MTYYGIMNIKIFRQLLELAIAEDLSDEGDVTSKAIFQDNKITTTLISKDTGVFAGAECLLETFRELDRNVQVRFFVKDGDSLQPDTEVAEIAGKAVSILQAERIAINFISFLSGIATSAKKHVEAAKHSGNAVILDTRKTLPGYRDLSKYAVQVGGGKNHRMGLYDMVMIKDNHIDAAGGIPQAVEAVRQKWGSRFHIEVECRTIEHVREALSLSVDYIMLDNMSPEEVTEAVSMKSGNVWYEVSGNMNEERIAQYSGLGIDFISVGGITHSVRAFDFSLRIPENAV